jgi:hypothetical protein
VSRSKIALLDTGPALTFISGGYRDLLMKVLELRDAELAAPETVIDEIDNKSQHGTFAGAIGVVEGWLSSGDITRLADDPADQELARCVQKVAGASMAERMLTARDLGETMVIAHAMRLQANGETVVALIEEWRGQDRATRMGVRFTDTQGILKTAAQYGLVKDRGEMRKIWDVLRPLDLSLVHWDQTILKDKRIYGQKLA